MKKRVKTFPFPKKDGSMSTVNLLNEQEIEDSVLELGQRRSVAPLVPGMDLIDLVMVGSLDTDPSKRTFDRTALFDSMWAQYLQAHGIPDDPIAQKMLKSLLAVTVYFWALGSSPAERTRMVRANLLRLTGIAPGSARHSWGQVGSGLVGGATDQASLAEELKDKPQFESNEQGLIAETLQPGAKPDIRITGIHMGTEMKTVAAIRAGQFVPFASLKRRRPPVVLRTPIDEQWSTTMTRDTVSQFQTFAHSEPPRKITRLVFPKSHLGILKGNTSSSL